MTLGMGMKQMKALFRLAASEHTGEFTERQTWSFSISADGEVREPQSFYSSKREPLVPESHRANLAKKSDVTCDPVGLRMVMNGLSRFLT